MTVLAAHRSASASPVVIGLNAVIVALGDDAPFLLTLRGRDAADPEGGELSGLPFGPLMPELHRTLEIGLRSWVEEQTALRLGYVEQLYTFGDQGRETPTAALGIHTPSQARIISVGYLALTPERTPSPAPDASWRSWYRAFPWEDHRRGSPAIIDTVLRPALDRWIGEAASPGQRERRQERAKLCFGADDIGWDEERVLDRYELLYEAGLVQEAQRDRHAAAIRLGAPATSPSDTESLGEAMLSDHRRILATAMSRLRGKIKYRPLVFDLMPEEFTLFELQQAVEALQGLQLHKPNFRRLVERSGLVEGTGRTARRTGGRPAELFQFRREVLQERLAPGVRIGGSR